MLFGLFSMNKLSWRYFAVKQKLALGRQWLVLEVQKCDNEKFRDDKMSNFIFCFQVP